MLTFPTLAERAIADFRAQTKTTAFGICAKRLGGERATDLGSWPIIWVFDDDTSVEVHGTGKNHKLIAQLP